ncbi:hypothetical protein L195_g033973 [Trifolium pratense]|uniref:Uncharacterized protein n=1 Tax=Trifolium pratense TaxID=57577 RepID=A0A2K3JS78_TRIPR|nr:hypothetical protein L195_g050109 [Trifolium pratense]PNX78000.1 hypothetical protein L195_g033973 [Trifolium pratense]
MTASSELIYQTCLKEEVCPNDIENKVWEGGTWFTRHRERRLQYGQDNASDDSNECTEDRGGFQTNANRASYVHNEEAK